MKKNLFLLILAGCLTTSISAQLSVGALNTKYRVTFDTTYANVNDSVYIGTGLDTVTKGGQLDSDAWKVTGFSSGNTNFGDGGKTTGDFAKGITSGGVFSGGMYAMTVAAGDYAFGIQPTGSDWTPGTVVFKIKNNTSSKIDTIKLSYDFYSYNDGDRGNSFNPSHSLNDTLYTAITALNDTTPGKLATSPSWVKKTKTITLTGLGIVAGGNFFLRWSSGDVLGSGSRDEMAIDNIEITAVGASSTPPPKAVKYYPIATVATDNSTGIPDSLNLKCILGGVVHGINMGGSSTVQFILYDATGAITVRKSGGFTPSYTVKEGDSIAVVGTVSQSNGLTQFNADTILVKVAGGRVRMPMKTAKPNASTESHLIRVDSVEIISGSWPSSGSSANLTVVSAKNDTLTVRIDRNGQVDDSVSAPFGKFDVIGYGVQYDSKSPYTSGYQILPQVKGHIIKHPATPPPPKATPHYGLGVVTTEDASGVADSANVACSVSGVVHGIDMSGLGSSSNTFQLIDATGHITVYKKSGFTPSYTVNESDSVTLYGKVTQYNGLTQFTPDSIKVHGNGAGLKSWKKVSKLDESTESDYIRIDSVRLLNASQWPKIGNNAYTVDILTQSGDTLTLNIDKDSYVDDSVAAPAGMFDIIGYGGQYDSKSPYTSGYQILPQLKNHIIMYAVATCNAPSALNTVSKTNVEIELGWTSGGSNTWNIEWGAMGSSATVITSTTNPHKFSGLMAATSYVFRVQDSCIGLGVSPWSGWDTIMTDAVAKVIPTYPISTVRTVDSNGVADSLDVMCYLHGVVITPTYREVGSGYEFHINDKSSPLNGINVIRFSGAEYVPRVGDSVKIFGKIDQYNGHIQMKALADSIWVLDSNKTVPMAMATGKLDETTESKLLLLNSWEIIDTTGWPTANYGNYDITNGTDTTIMRMDGDRNWATNMPSPPLGKFCVIGVGGQYDGSKPHSASYQILPRDSNDFIACPPACKESTDLETDSITDNSVSVKWTTGGATTWNVGWAKGHASTEPSDSVMGVTTNPYTITGIDAGQHYHIWIQDVCAFNESKWAGPTMFTTLATGINNVDGNKASLIAFPNPNNIGEVRFNMEVTVTVRNILGQTVKSAKEVTSLDISDLDSGVYLIQSEEGDTIRFIVE